MEVPQRMSDNPYEDLVLTVALDKSIWVCFQEIVTCQGLLLTLKIIELL
jgi:hypothetical protein